MAFNMDAILRITAQTRGTQEVVALNDAVSKLGDETEKTGEKIESASQKGSTWKAVASVAALTAGLTFATKSAVEFESGMADVRKVVDGLGEPAALRSISGEIISLSQRLPMTAEGFASIYAAAGQSGIAKDQLKDFSLLVTDVATAFDFTAEEAGTSLAQIKTALNLSTPELEKLADAMNYVENNTGATARGLVEFMTRSASAGKIAGLNATETLAFGAAMTQSGVETEVAATSFNNMIRALSKGPSMTDRQTEALRKLGYGVINAAEAEKRLTEEAERSSEDRVKWFKKEAEETVRTAEKQAEDRMRIARKETGDLIGEIEERFRKQRQIREDGFEDQDIQNKREQQKALDNQIELLEKEQKADVDAERERQRLAAILDSEALDRIGRFYDDKIEQLRQNAEDEERLEERRKRDARDAIEKEYKTREEKEKKAAESMLTAKENSEKENLETVKKYQKERIETIEKQESEALKKTKEEAKKRGEELAANFSQGFADRLQKNAVGTIGEVLERIGDLPKSQQLSVLSDLFGDEARGLAPLLSNLDELKRILSLVSEEQEYLGSTSSEAAVRFTTSAAKLKVFNNNMTALKIAVGETLLPLLLGILKPLQSIVYGLTAVTNAGKGFISGVIERTVLLSVFSKAIVEVTGVAISLGIALGGLMSLVTLNKWAGGIKLLALMPGPLRLVAIALTAIGAAATPLGPIISAVGTELLAVQAIKFGVSVARGVALIMPAFTGLLAWMTGTFLPVMAGIFSGPVGWVALAVAAVVAGVILFRKPIMEFFSWIGETVGGWAQGFMGLVSDVVIKPLIRLWDSVKQPVSNIFANISYLAGEAFKLLSIELEAVFNTLIGLGYDIFIEPWTLLWDAIKQPAVDTYKFLSIELEAVFNTLIGLGYAIFIAPWTTLWSAIKQPAVDTYKFLGIELEAVFNALVQLGYDLFIKPWTDLWAAIKKPAEDTFKAIAKIAQNVFNGIIKWIYDKYLKPWVETWNFLTQEPKKFKENVGKMIEDTLVDLNRKFSNLASWLSTPFAVAGNAIKSIFNSVLGAAAGSFNQIAAQINRLLVNVNNAARQLKLPQVAYLEAIQYTPLESDKIAPPTLAKVAAPQPPAPKPAAEIRLPELDYKDIPAMARGGWVARPTIAQIGDTGRAGGEYAIPGEMMPAAMAAWNQGARGDALVSAMRSGGLAPGSSLGGSWGGGGGRAQLNLSIQTGPVLQQPDGSQWVRREELAAVAERVFVAAVDASNSSAARSMSGWS